MALSHAACPGAGRARTLGYAARARRAAPGAVGAAGRAASGARPGRLSGPALLPVHRRAHPAAFRTWAAGASRGTPFPLARHALLVGPPAAPCTPVAAGSVWGRPHGHAGRGRGPRHDRHAVAHALD